MWKYRLVKIFGAEGVLEPHIEPADLRQKKQEANRRRLSCKYSTESPEEERIDPGTCPHQEDLQMLANNLLQQVIPGKKNNQKGTTNDDPIEIAETCAAKNWFFSGLLPI
jgi:hypothetical protein